MTILLWKFNWPHYDTCGGIKKDAVRLALTLINYAADSIRPGSSRSRPRLAHEIPNYGARRFFLSVVFAVT
jgi:hypothetical protein